jgi:hypothetical protein
MSIRTTCRMTTPILLLLTGIYNIRRWLVVTWNEFHTEFHEERYCNSLRLKDFRTKWTVYTEKLARVSLHEVQNCGIMFFSRYRYIVTWLYGPLRGNGWVNKFSATTNMWRNSGRTLRDGVFYVVRPEVIYRGYQSSRQSVAVMS